MNITNVLMVIAVIAVVISGVNVLNTISLQSATGRAADTSGDVNLTIESQIHINFTTNVINWSTGYVGTLTDRTYLTSDGIMYNNMSFKNVSKGLVLESLSNQNISVNVTFLRNSVDFLDGGIARSPPSQFFWKVNQVYSDDPAGYLAGESGTCGPTAGGLYPTSWTIVTTTPLIGVCPNMGWQSSADELEIDLAVNISNVAPPGVKNNLLTAIAFPYP